MGANAFLGFLSPEDMPGGNDIVSFCVQQNVPAEANVSVSDSKTRSSFIVARLSVDALPILCSAIRALTE